MRGAPQSGFSSHILRIKSRSSWSTFGRPPRLRDFQRHQARNPCPVPANNRLRLDDRDGANNPRKEPIKPYKQGLVGAGQLRSLWDFACSTFN